MHSGGAGGAGGAADDFASDLLPSTGLVTSSDEYYPTVAINALMRVLRDPTYVSQHMNVISALMSIFKALALSSVPYLPKVSLQQGCGRVVARFRSTFCATLCAAMWMPLRRGFVIGRLERLRLVAGMQHCAVYSNTVCDLLTLVH